MLQDERFASFVQCFEMYPENEVPESTSKAYCVIAVERGIGEEGEYTRGCG